MKIFFFLIWAFLILNGCATSKKKFSIEDLNMQLAELQSANSYSNSKLEELSSRLFALQEEIEANTLSINQIKEERKKVGEDKKLSVDNKIQVQLPDNKQVNATPSVDFRDALNMFNKKNYKGALVRFESFLKKHPGNNLAPDAWYWIGEINYDRKNYEEAINNYKKITEEFPVASKIDSAILKMGLCYLQTGDNVKAKARFKEVLEIYPNSASAIIAKQKLDGMK